MDHGGYNRENIGSLFMQQQYRLDHIVYFFSLLMLFLIGILLFEWSRIKNYSQELIELKQDYQAYIQLLRRKIPEPDDNYVITLSDLFFVNRDFHYLKTSALLYLKDELDMQGMDIYKDETEESLGKQQSTRKISPPRSNQKTNKSAELPQNVSLFTWPVERGQFWLSSPFGPRRRPDGSPGFHQGIDLAATKGTKVHAAASGMILEAGFSPGYGNTIVIMHNKKYKTRYAHLDKIVVRRNQKVERGQNIGTVGDTGLVRSEGGDASHLHFEVYVFGKRLNPRKFLP